MTLRLVFDRDDLARVRLAEAPDPMWELVLSLHLARDRPGLGAALITADQTRDRDRDRPRARRGQSLVLSFFMIMWESTLATARSAMSLVVRKVSKVAESSTATRMR
jgi:hypothetical protein